MLFVYLFIKSCVLSTANRTFTALLIVIPISVHRIIGR
jgi:hypothetical protein